MTPWVFVTAHCPLYNPFTKHENETQALMMKDAMESLFIEYGVNVVFSGHAHAFSRSKNVAMDDVSTLSGPIYIITGDSGRKPKSAPYQSPLPEHWLESIDNENNSIGTVEMINATHAWWHRIITTTGILWEEAIIVNQYHVTAPLSS